MPARADKTSIGSSRRASRTAPCVALLLATAVLCLGEPGVRDCRTFFGVARGAGEVLLSPVRGFRFSSARPSDIAFAQTSAPLPMAYRIALTVSEINTHNSGCRFGIFEGDARHGGENDTINALTKYAVVFQEIRDQRLIYVWYFDGEGSYFCWDGERWCENSWRHSGARWTPGKEYSIVLEKTLSGFLCEVRQADQTLAAPSAVRATRVRGAGTPDYLAFGDMVTDFVAGELSVASVTIEETAMEPYLSVEMTHTVIRQAPEGRYAMYGGLTRLADDGIVCVYKVGSVDEEGSPWTIRDEQIVWTRSSDGGLTWAEAENLIYEDRSTRQENCCGTGYLSDSGVFMHPFYVLNTDYEERAKQANWSKLHLAVSRDGLKTWEIRQVETPLAIAASFGGIVKLKDGTLVLNLYGAAERGSFRHQAGMIRSRDEGDTWSDYTIIGQHADPDGGPARLNETDIVELPDGKLLSMSRTQYHGYPLYRGFSEDGGQSWTVEPSELTGLCPALCYTSAGPLEGTVVIAYHDRWGAHALKGGIYLAFSHDGGATWGEPLWISRGAYPCLIETGQGKILCSYYQSHSLLRATTFEVPFPTGLRAEGGVPGSMDAGIRLTWDRYVGRAAQDYSYRVFRSGEAPVQPEEGNLIGTVTNACAYDDAQVLAGQVHFYRVAAYEGERRVGMSWTACARATKAQDNP